MKKTLGVSIGVVALLAVASIGATRVAMTATGGNIPRRSAQAADGGNTGSGQTAVEEGGSIGSRQVVVAGATPLGDIVAGKIPDAPTRTDSERPERDPYKTGYPIQDKTRSRQVEDADALSDPPKPETKAPETRPADPRPAPEPKEGRAGRDGGGDSGGGSGSGGGSKRGEGRDFTIGRGGDGR